ncbi:hypothetical protein J6590_080591 [Homalodisca vitripennis]|nr:hypothetical protein J6590_080591 [Homalodisca vitripennis]
MVLSPWKNGNLSLFQPLPFKAARGLYSFILRLPTVVNKGSYTHPNTHLPLLTRPTDQPFYPDNSTFAYRFDWKMGYKLVRSGPSWEGNNVSQHNDMSYTDEIVDRVLYCTQCTAAPSA